MVAQGTDMAGANLTVWILWSQPCPWSWEYTKFWLEAKCMKISI